MIYTLNNTPVSSQIVNEDYLPLKVVYDDTVNCNYIGFYNNDNLLEICTDKATGNIKRLVVINCKTFEFSDDSLAVPDAVEEGTLAVHLANRIECSNLSLTVFHDGVSIALSEESPQHYCRCGNVYYGFDQDGENLLNVIVAQMTEAEIGHIKDELLIEAE